MAKDKNSKAPKAPAAKAPAAPAAAEQKKIEYRIPGGRGRQQQNPGILMVNMGPMTVKPGSVKELKGKFGKGLSAQVTVPTRTQPIYISTYDPEQMEVLKAHEKHQKPIRQLLGVARTMSMDPETGKTKSSLFYRMTGIDSAKPQHGYILEYGTKEVPNAEGVMVEVGKTTAFIEGALGKEQIKVTKDGGHVTGQIMASGHPIRFTVPMEVAKQCAIGQALHNAENGNGSYVRMVAEVYVDSDPTYGASLQVPLNGIQGFWLPFAKDPVATDDDSEDHSQAPAGDVPGM